MAVSRASVVMVLADARRVPLRDGCVQCVVTSPPYFGLRDYGVAGQIGLEPSPDAYVASMVAVFSELRRVLADDGVCWLNLGDSYVSNGRYDQAYESRMNRTAASANNWDKYASGDPRQAAKALKVKDLVGIPWRVAFALQADGWYLRSDIIWSKPNPMPESVTDRPTKAHEYVFLLTKSERYFYDADAISEALLCPNERRRPVGSNGAWQIDGRERRSNGGGASYDGYPLRRNARSVWSIVGQPYPGSHFATMPEKLAERCILAGSRPGDLVFDPFGGSGTTVRVARRFNRRGVMLDLNPAYLELAEERTSELQPMLLELGEETA